MYRGPQGRRMAPRGSPQAPALRGREGEESQPQSWGRSGMGGARAQKGRAEAPGELRRLARSAAPDADTAHRIPARLVQSATLGTGQVARARPHPSWSPSLPVLVSVGPCPSRSTSLAVPIPPAPSLQVLYIPLLAESDQGCSPDPLRSTKAEKLGSTKPAPPTPLPCSPCAPCTPVPAGCACCSRHRVGPGSGGSACARGPSCLAGGAKTHCGSCAPSR